MNAAQVFVGKENLAEYRRIKILEYVNEFIIPTNVNTDKQASYKRISSKEFDEIEEMCSILNINLGIQDQVAIPSIKPGVIKVNHKSEAVAIPKLYRNVGIISIILFFGILAMMFYDAVYHIFSIGAPAYIVTSLCCLSMFFTNLFALKEWKTKNGRK